MVQAITYWCKRIGAPNKIFKELDAAEKRERKSQFFKRGMDVALVIFRITDAPALSTALVCPIMIRR